MHNIHQNLNLVDDICPVSEFRSDINAKIQHTKETHRPLILTQHGKTTAVVMDINDYQRLIYEKQFLSDIMLADEQFAQGKTYSTKTAKSMIAKRSGSA
jgi:prevent-host-death family protein